MQNAEQIWNLVDAKRDAFAALADRVWGMPETCYTEHRSVAEHIAELNRQGFKVTENLADIPTAVMGEAGEGGPVIAILGEYDALPGLSQEADVAEHRPIPGNGNGHGCGHNLLGSAALLAATAVKDWLAETGTPGRVRYYGCPAEEGGAAKAFMVREGAFNDVDIAITWHPNAFNEVAPALSLANTRVDFLFTGRASHAAASPHLGRSALDAVELMNVGVNYMREHMPSDARIHYAMIDGGGIAPNVVQAKARVRYSVRAPELPVMLALLERVKNVARGAALMTETQLDIQVLGAVSNLLANPPLEQAMFEAMQRLGAPEWDESEKAFAKKIQGTLAPEDLSTAYRRVGIGPKADTPLHDGVVPLGTQGVPMIGSTDVGDVSWVVPTVQAHAATYAIGTPGHSWQLTAQGKNTAAHKGMTFVAKVMAATAIDAAQNPALIQRAKADLAERTAASPYICPIPEGIPPPIAAMSLASS
ncbi:M20 family metallopeptidase [Acidisphaera sp. L21]|uniref:M20 family metallopeptidase n=1 Tax=Acidisphaera sp. L21 TaxID=1641851 RepID=UPI00131DC52B|nr:M20 family metallopeptidase [Acidisphaera sp. L21]